MTFVSTNIADSINFSLNTNFLDRVFDCKYDRYGIVVKYYFKDGRYFDLSNFDYDLFLEKAFSILCSILDDFVLSHLSFEFVGYSRECCEGV